jgi:hypothetical protein
MRESFFFLAASTLLQSPDPPAVVASPRLFIAIPSGDSSKYHARREAVRRTWGAHLPENVSLHFFVSEDAAEEVRHEANVVALPLTDTYMNLTKKSIAMMQWFLSKATPEDYLAKVDDDVYLRPAFLLREAVARPKPLLFGRLIKNSKPMRKPTAAWYIPVTSYPNETYPAYCVGSTYAMSRDTVEAVVAEAGRQDSKTWVPFEDVQVGIWALNAGVKPQDGGFKLFPSVTSRGPKSFFGEHGVCSEDAVSVFPSSPTTMSRLHARLTQTKRVCDQEQKTARVQYEFFLPKRAPESKLL